MKRFSFLKGPHPPMHPRAGSHRLAPDWAGEPMVLSSQPVSGMLSRALARIRSITCRKHQYHKSWTSLQCLLNINTDLFQESNCFLITEGHDTKVKCEFLKQKHRNCFCLKKTAFFFFTGISYLSFLVFVKTIIKDLPWTVNLQRCNVFWLLLISQSCRLIFLESSWCMHWLHTMGHIRPTQLWLHNDR